MLIGPIEVDRECRTNILDNVATCSFVGDSFVVVLCVRHVPNRLGLN